MTNESEMLTLRSNPPNLACPGLILLQIQEGIELVYAVELCPILNEGFARIE